MDGRKLASAFRLIFLRGFLFALKAKPRKLKLKEYHIMATTYYLDVPGDGG